MMPIYGNSRTCDILVPDEAEKTGFQDMMDDNLSVENQVAGGVRSVVHSMC